MPTTSQKQVDLPQGHDHADEQCGCAGNCAGCTCRQERAPEEVKPGV